LAIPLADFHCGSNSAAAARPRWSLDFRRLTYRRSRLRMARSSTLKPTSASNGWSMSALERFADASRTWRQFRDVPISEVRQAAGTGDARSCCQPRRGICNDGGVVEKNDQCLQTLTPQVPSACANRHRLQPATSREMSLSSRGLTSPLDRQSSMSWIPSKRQRMAEPGDR
jgi:hypothetical protein